MPVIFTGSSLYINTTHLLHLQIINSKFISRLFYLFTIYHKRLVSMHFFLSGYVSGLQITFITYQTCHTCCNEHLFTVESFTCFYVAYRDSNCFLSFLWMNQAVIIQLWISQYLEHKLKAISWGVFMKKVRRHRNIFISIKLISI